MKENEEAKIKLEDFLDPNYYETPVSVVKDSIEYIHHEDWMLPELAKIYMNVFNKNNVRIKEEFGIGNGFWHEPLWTETTSTNRIKELFEEPFHTICVGKDTEGKLIILGASIYIQTDFEKLLARYSYSFGLAPEDFPNNFISDTFFRVADTFRRPAQFTDNQPIRGLAAQMNNIVEEKIKEEMGEKSVTISSTTRNSKMKDSWESQNSFIKPVEFRDGTNGWLRLRELTTSPASNDK